MYIGQKDESTKSATQLSPETPCNRKPFLQGGARIRTFGHLAKCQNEILSKIM